MLLLFSFSIPHGQKGLRVHFIVLRALPFGVGTRTGTVAKPFLACVRSKCCTGSIAYGRCKFFVEPFSSYHFFVDFTPVASANLETWWKKPAVMKRGCFVLERGECECGEWLRLDSCISTTYAENLSMTVASAEDHEFGFVVLTAHNRTLLPVDVVQVPESGSNGREPASIVGDRRLLHLADPLVVQGLRCRAGRLHGGTSGA